MFYMVFVVSFLVVVFGLFLGVLLLVSKKGYLLNKFFLYKILDILINMICFFFFIIFIILFLFLLCFLIGISIGFSVSIILLVILVIFFVVKFFENFLMEVEYGKIEIILSLGVFNLEVIKMMFLESLSFLVNNIIIILIFLIGYLVMVGVLGVGGLGDLVIRIGY